MSRRDPALTLRQMIEFADDADVLWDAAARDVPELRAKIAAILADGEDSAG